MDGDECTVRVRIKGRVQGVGYRYWAERAAGELGLSGWVRNLSDGSVEALFSGKGSAVDTMITRCRQGPRSAIVTSLAFEGVEPAPPRGFVVLPTR